MYTSNENMRYEIPVDPRPPPPPSLDKILQLVRGQKPPFDPRKIQFSVCATFITITATWLHVYDQINNYNRYNQNLKNHLAQKKGEDGLTSVHHPPWSAHGATNCQTTGDSDEREITLISFFFIWSGGHQNRISHVLYWERIQTVINCAISC